MTTTIVDRAAASIVSPANFSNNFLIAMPATKDPIFAGAVIYCCQHSEQGAVGLMINRPTDLDLQSIFYRIDIKLDIKEINHLPVCYGGPIQSERGFVLHEKNGHYSSSLGVVGGLEITTSKDILEEVANGFGPKRFALMLGHTGWAAGQLEQEIAQNGWLHVEARPEIIFDVPPNQRFDAALGLLGIKQSMLSGKAGHA